mmetsp:Transcript_100178/g.272351  ORF Transcript_100178/g.272351 Transcript_100178/m.272351 type:complete len:247 (-) Transcript_100178:188-928(-)
MVTAVCAASVRWLMKPLHERRSVFSGSTSSKSEWVKMSRGPRLATVNIPSHSDGPAVSSTCPPTTELEDGESAPLISEPVMASVAEGRSALVASSNSRASGCAFWAGKAFRSTNSSSKLLAPIKASSCALRTSAVRASTAVNPSMHTSSKTPQSIAKGSHLEKSVSHASSRNMSGAIPNSRRCRHTSGKCLLPMRSKATLPCSSSGRPGSHKPRTLRTTSANGGNASAGVRKCAAATAATWLMPWQ